LGRNYFWFVSAFYEIEEILSIRGFFYLEHLLPLFELDWLGFPYLQSMGLEGPRDPRD
jgi:hypothetical protein